MAKITPTSDQQQLDRHSVCARAISGLSDLKLTTNGQQLVWQLSNSTPQRQGSVPTAESEQLAGITDALAMRLKYSDADLFEQQRPHSPIARILFERLEQARVEQIGCAQLPGCRHNIERWLLQRCQQRNPQLAINGIDLLLRQHANSVMQKGQLSPFIEQCKLTNTQHQLFSKLVTEIASQQPFGDTANALITLLLDEVRSAASQTDEQLLDAMISPPQRNRNADTKAPMQSISLAFDLDGFALLSDKRKRRPLPKTRTASEAPDISQFRYQIFSSEFDQQLSASELSDTAEILQLRAELDRYMARFHEMINRVAHRLQRYIQALQRRSWQFEQEEGQLDTARLARVVTDPLLPLSFKQESESRFPDTVVSILIDHSGSMRGHPIRIAALCSETLGTALERCGIKCEILGFTTAEWRGGQSGQQWQKQRKPRNPGRISDLRHILYKAADQPFTQRRKLLGIMLKPDLLKENIDGEALLWAHQRLSVRPEPRRILMVISDGAPMDDLTLAANGSRYLESHLHQVIGQIRQRSSVQLAAIGIGHDVGTFYPNAIRIQNVDSLAEAMCNQLMELLKPPAGS